MPARQRRAPQRARCVRISFALPPLGLLRFFDFARCLPVGAPALLLRLRARALARLRKLQDRVLEELYQAEHRGSLGRIERLGAHQQLLLVVGVVQLGEVFPARLVDDEFNAKLSHANLLRLISITWQCVQSRSRSRAGPRSCSPPSARSPLPARTKFW